MKNIIFYVKPKTKDDLKMMPKPWKIPVGDKTYDWVKEQLP